MALTIRGLVPLLEVFDLPKSVAFYRDVLGFEMVAGDEAWWCMLKLGEETSLMLNTAYERDERPPEPEPPRVSAHADTSLYFASPDLDGVYEHLRIKGWPVTAPEVTSYGMRQVSTTDPDGFRIFFHAASAA